MPVIVTSEDSASRVTSITVRSPSEAFGPWLAALAAAAEDCGEASGTWGGHPDWAGAAGLLDAQRLSYTRPRPGYRPFFSVNARTHLPVTTAAFSRRASVSQVWPVGRRTEPEAL